MHKLVVNDKKFDGKLLSDFLFFNFDGLSRNTFYKALRKKDIRINDVKTNENKTVFLGDVITVYILDDFLFKNIEIEKIFEDDNILIVNKPADLEVTGSNSLTSLLEKEYDFISPCHRLDRNTTGIVLFAKNNEALAILLDKFRKHEIEKHYLAKIYGIPKENHKDMKAFLFKDNKKSFVIISDTPKKGYVPIETSFTVVNKNIEKNFSVLDVKLTTGKTHQIRAHLAHIGFPIIGDGKYGINEINRKFGVKTQLLHSYMLKFNFSSDSGFLNYLNSKTFKCLKF